MVHILLIYFLLQLLARKPQGDVLSVYFGIPGSGKSTFASHLAKKSMRESKFRVWLREKNTLFTWKLSDFLNLKKPEFVYSNVAITGTMKLDPKEDLGTFIVRGGRVIIDEAGLEFNSREFKSFAQKNRLFFKMFRHEEVKVDVFSQSYDDMDKTIRALAHNFYIVKPSLIPYFIVAIKIKRDIGVDKEQAVIRERYQSGSLFERDYCFAPSVWKLFNSHSKIPGLIPKEWETW